MESPTKRVVLLGASNLMRGISTVIETAQLTWGTPLDVMTACGHGRSYGMTSNFLGRGLPAIVSCGLWEDLAGRTPLPTAALITDVGNDIAYGVGTKQITVWLDQILERLTPICQRIVITGLPLERFRRLSPWHFQMFRRILFPRSRLTFEDALRNATDVDAYLRAAAAKHGAAFIAPRREWYGIDPIHIRLQDWSRAWSATLEPWREQHSQTAARGSLLRWMKLRAQRPLVRTLFGIKQQRAQPTCTLRDETIVSMY